MKLLSVTKEDFLNQSLIQERINNASYLRNGEKISIETACGYKKIYQKTIRN